MGAVARRGRQERRARVHDAVLGHPFGWPFLEERLRGAQWLALALAFAGLVLVLELWRGEARSEQLARARGRGVVGHRHVIFKRIPVRRRDELLSLTTWQMFFGCIPLIAAALLTPERPIEWNATLIAALAFNAVGAMAVATLLWLYILHRLPTTISSLSSLIVPIVGVVAAWIQLGERPSLSERRRHGLILVGARGPASCRSAWRSRTVTGTTVVSAAPPRGSAH